MTLRDMLGGDARGMILLVDDDDVLRGVLDRVLRKAGYEVVASPDGQRALPWLVDRREEVDAVVCDVIMARMNGILFGERMREMGIDVPLVYMSGVAEESALRDWGIPPSVPFLEKPFEPERLLETLDRVVGRR